MNTLVLGIGNTLLTDEGAGVHATHYLKQNFLSLPCTTIMDGGTLSFTLAAPIENCDNLIVIDAAQLNAHPGTVKTFVGKDMDVFVASNNKRSVHEVGLEDLILIAKLTGKLPGNRALIGIQPASMAWGDVPSKDVKAAIPGACDQVMQLIEEWRI